MPQTYPAVTLHAANSNPGGATSIHLALTGLIGLMARAEVRAIAEAKVANIAEPASKPESHS